MKFLLILVSFFIVTSANAGECDFIKFNKCQSCDNPLAFNVGSDAACSYLCPNREINYAGSGSAVLARNCALKNVLKIFRIVPKMAVALLQSKKLKKILLKRWI